MIDLLLNQRQDSAKQINQTIENIPGSNVEHYSLLSLEYNFTFVFSVCYILDDSRETINKPLYCNICLKLIVEIISLILQLWSKMRA